MPDKEEQTTKRHAKSDLRKGRSASTAAGEFVREEMHHIRRGVHGARSTKQAIAIGLSKARRAGIPLKQPDGEKAAKPKPHRVSATRSRAISKALRREPHRAASKRALSAHAHSSARKRGHANLSAAARKAVSTKGPAERHAAAKKAARTRARHAR